MTISLPAEMRRFVDRQVDAGSFASASEFIRQLVRVEQKRVERAKLEGMLVEGLESGEGTEATEQYLADLGRRMQSRIAPRRRTKAGSAR